MRLAEAQQRWQDSGITSYCINVEYIAFISYAGPRVLEVRNGNIVAQPPPCMGGSNRCLSSTERAEDYTVPGLFAFLQGELSDPGRQVNLVAFDAMYGYPIWITTDTRSNATDMGRMRVVTSFMPLP